MKYQQKTQEFIIKIADTFSVDLNQIDAWLSDILKIKIEPFKPLQENNKTLSEEEIAHFAWRVLLLSKTLLQAIRIPIFDTGHVKKINNEDAHGCAITLDIVFIEHIQKKVYLSVVNVAINILVNFMKKPQTTENIYELFNIIQTQIMTPHMNSSGSGKSTLPMLQAAHELGIPFVHLSNGIYQLGWGSKSRRINRSIIDTDSAIGSQISQNKIVTAMLLRNAGLPAPEHALVVSQEEAMSVAQKLGWRVVVKPADQDRGEGVTIDVTSDELLIKAFNFAFDISLSKQVIIERQVEGVCCRVFIANNKMLYAVKRLPKSVKGDGLQSVKELIEEANTLENATLPWQRGEPFPNDALAIEAMRDAGFTMGSIPNQGELVPLRKVESTQWGGVDEDITTTIHPDNLDIALRAAKLFGLQVCGIDIITSDISMPWHKNGAIINEVNFSPLLGGGDISKRMIPAYLKEFVVGDGRIPITVIVGDKKAMRIAQELQKEQLLYSEQCFISSHDKTISSKGEEIYYISESLHQRCKALLFDIRVDTLILVVQTDEFLNSGLPIDRIDKIIIASQELFSWKNKDEKLSNASFDNIIELLKTANI
ncbi:MAG: carboxylate--amine ligase [Sulfurimonas sp.]|nr:carboxylate--amine ligase [Sulfurimonas sp.]